MKQTPIVFRVDQGDYHPVFCLKQITVSDDSNFLQRFIDIADKEGDEKADAMYRIKAEILAEWAAPFQGKKKPKEVLDSPEAIKEFFADADVDKDWISEHAINALRSRHQPNVSFFSASQL